MDPRRPRASSTSGSGAAHTPKERAPARSHWQRTQPAPNEARTRPPRTKRTALDFQVGRRHLQLSNLGKVWYPRSGTTKGQVIDYYIRIGAAILPHLKDRPLNLKRYPDGVEAPFFYQKECPAYRPEWMRQTADLWSETKGGATHHCMANELASLLWLVNAGDLEIHTFLAQRRNPAVPTQLVFDLDPGEGSDALTCAKVALLARAELKRRGLQSFAKVSGSKGVQLHVPLNPLRGGATYEVAKPFAHAIADRLAAASPKLVTANMRKDLRKGRVFVDWSQNDFHKSTVCAYSLRAKEKPSVAAPVTWEELQAALDGEDLASLQFTPEDAVRRFERDGDLLAPAVTLRQKLPAP